MAAQPVDSWTLRIAEPMFDQLHRHLFPGDLDEHGAVIGVTVQHTPRGTRLLARRLFLATDGADYVPGQRGYRMLTSSFVSDVALACEAEGLGYLAVHCHGGDDRVAFSGPDLASHERGYPALLDILDGQPVGGLVFARNAVAGDIWLPDHRRVPLHRLDVVGVPARRLCPQPPAAPPASDERYDRQARLFGDRGQAMLAAQKVGVIGAGGAGSLIIEYLSRLGVGELVVLDPDRIDPTNLPRVVGSTRRDLRPMLTHRLMPRFLRDYGERVRTHKVTIAERVARAANPNIEFRSLAADVTAPEVASQLTDCDYVFLAADRAQARLVFNAVVHQYLIPGVQVGAKVHADRQTGTIHDVFAVSRQVLPGRGCLWCNGLISSARLQEEATDARQRERQNYGLTEVPAPSVITLNAIATAHACNEYLFNQVGLQERAEMRWVMFHPREHDVARDEPRHDSACHECCRRLGAGPLLRLPTKAS